MAMDSDKATGPGVEVAEPDVAGTEFGIDSLPEQEPTGEQAQAQEAEAEVEKEPVVEEVEKAPEAAAPTFDPSAFGIDPGSALGKRLASCASVEEALRLTAQEHVNLQKVYGAHTDEVGRTRAELERLKQERAGQAATAAPVPDLATTKSPARQRWDQLQAMRQVNPEGAEQWVREQMEADPVGIMQWQAEMAQEVALEQVSRQMAQRDARDQQERQQEEYDEAMREWQGLVERHPDANLQRQAMQDVQRDLGLWPSYADLYDLAAMRAVDLPGYQAVARLVRRGLSLVEAKEYHELRAKKAALENEQRKQARASEADKLGRISRAASSGAARTPGDSDTGKHAWGIEDLEP